MRIRATAGLAAASLALALGACGNDEEVTTGEATETTKTDLSKEEYIVQADAICLRVNQDLQGIDEEAFQQEGVPIIEQGLADLRAIPAPQGDEEQVGRVLDAGDEELATLQEATEPPRGDPFEEFTRLADDYGFKDGCTRNEG
jgi:hypothetical protein